jgi:hypothetical protein
LPGSYNQNSDDSKICNEYSIGWNNTTVVAYAAGSNTASKTAYGSGKLFSVPGDKVESTSPSAFKILYVTSAGAAEVGANILARYKDIKKTCTFQAGYHLNFISLGDVLDLRFSPFTREPVRVVSMKPARDKQQIEFTCEFVNSPQVVALDLTAPDPVQMFEALYFEDSILLRWSHSTKADLMNYKLYFSTSEGYWGNEFNAGRFSPITIPVSSISFIDGDFMYSLLLMRIRLIISESLRQIHHTTRAENQTLYLFQYLQLHCRCTKTDTILPATRSRDLLLI